MYMNFDKINEQPDKLLEIFKIKTEIINALELINSDDWYQTIDREQMMRSYLEKSLTLIGQYFD